MDVFVEYCRSGEVSNIDELLNSCFENPSERVSYKSSLLWCMFNKLIAKAVNESYYYLEDPYFNPNSTNAPDSDTSIYDKPLPFRWNLHPPIRIPVIYNPDDSETIFTAVDSFLEWYFDTKDCCSL